MPSRFQQQKLASAQVGTPGVDQSAGLVEEKIAETSQRLQSQDVETRMRSLRQAEQDFNSARISLFYANQQQEAIRRAEEEEQRRLQAQLDRFDEDDRMNSLITSLKQQYADSPQAAVTAFQSQIPELRNQFQERYAEDPKRLRMLLPNQRASERQAFDDLSTWANQSVTRRLEARLNLLPKENELRITQIQGTIDEQVKSYLQLADNQAQVYRYLAGRTLTQESYEKVLGEALTSQTKLGNSFVDYLEAQIPEGREGLNYISTLKDVVRNARGLGIMLSPDDQRRQLEHLTSLEKGRETQEILDIQNDGIISVIDAKRLRVDLDDAQGNPIAMAQIDKQMKAQVRTLEQQIAEVQKEPNDRIRKAKLTAIKQTQDVLISGAEKETNLQRSLQSIERAVRGEARAVAGFAMAQTRFLQSQEDRAIRKEHGEVVQSFNDNWRKILDKVTDTLALSPGPVQQAQMQKVVTEGFSVLDDAQKKGAIKAQDYKRLLGSLYKQTETVNLTKTTREWWGLGAERTVPLSSEEAKKRRLEIRQQFNSIVSNERQKTEDLKAAIASLNQLTTDVGQRAILEQYASVNLPILLDDARYRAATPEQRSRMRALWLTQAISQFNRKELR